MRYAILSVQATALLMVNAAAGPMPISQRVRNLQQEVVECENDEETVSFDLLLDDRPQETGFRLTCDGVDIWSVKPGHFLDRPTEWVTQQTCVPTSVKHCTLTLVDTSGDGLTGDGWFSLDFGATSIAVYDQLPFSTHTFCFGSNCDEAPLEVADMQKECKPVLLELGLDNAPKETSFKLVCDEQVLWNVKQLNSPFEKIQLEECVQPYACCHFTIHDSGNNGLVTGNSTHTGYFSLEADYQKKISYSGQDGMQFSTLSIAFGNDNKCSAAQIVSQINSSTNSESNTRSFDIGAIVGSFFGGMVIASLAVGLVLRIWQSTKLSDDAQPLSEEQPGSADNGSKASAGEQATAWSDADFST